MTDDRNSGWAPPEAGPAIPSRLDAGVSVPNPAPPSAHLLPPPVPPRKRPKWLIPLIVVGGLSVLSGIVGVVVVFVLLVYPSEGVHVFFGDPLANDQPLTVGAPASPVALEPLECPPACFDRMSMRETILPDRSFSDLGVPNVTAPFGTWPEDTAGMLNRYHSAELTGHLEPDACFFIPTIAPYSAAQSLTEWHSVDPIFHTGTYEDRFGNVAEQSVRLFKDSASAELYMRTLSEDVALCDRVDIEIDGYYYRAVVDPAVSISPPRSVASIGWIATGAPGPGWRSYVYDIQRGNLVTRVSLYTDGSITEQDFRRVVRFAAAQLASVPTVEVAAEE